MLGLEQHISNEIQVSRMDEVSISKNFRTLIVGVFFFAKAPSIIAPFTTFLVFWIRSSGGTLTLGTAFTALSIIALLTSPLQTLLTTMPNCAASLGCVRRVERYLVTEDRKDGRIKDNYKILPIRNSWEVDTHDSVFPTHHTIHSFPMISRASPPTGQEEPIVIENACFRNADHSDFYLQDISLRCTPSSLTIVIGPVGCGKSSLLKALLGEMVISKGHISVNSSANAYCGEQSWLSNSTIRENIVGESAADITDWYDTVLDACALKYDLARFPLGDLTSIGSGGSTLSGGQKQRISLARAIYSRTSIAVLDDSFTGLDANTERVVFNKLCGREGLFRTLGTTVVFATNSTQHLELSDHIVVMGGNGCIAEQGSFEQLRSHQGFVSDLTLHPPSRSSDTKEEQSDAAPQSNDPLPVEISLLAHDLTRQTGDFSTYQYYFKSIGWRLGSTMLSVLILVTFTTTFPQEWLNIWVVAEEANPSVHSAMYIGVYGMLAGMGMIALPISIWVMFLRVVPKTANNLHWTLLQTVMRAPLSYFSTTSTGVILNRFSQDMMLVDTQLPEALFYTISAVFMCVAQVLLIATGASYISATIPFAVVAIYFLQKYYLRTSRQLRLMDLEAKSPLYSHFAEALSGLLTIRAFGWQNRFQECNLRLLDISQRPYYLLFCIQRWLNLVLDLIVATIAIALVALAVEVQSNRGAIGVALVSVLTFNQTLADLITSWTKLETSLGAIARLKDYSTRTPREDQSRHGTRPTSDSWPERGQLEFADVTASYQ